jgi:hypothetical protein
MDIKVQFDMNFKLADESINVADWQNASSSWKNLNEDMGVDASLTPLEIKALYLLGTMFNICESVSFLLNERDFARQVSYIPAYGIYASGIELLGRAVQGEESSYRSCLSYGLQWLCKPTLQDYINCGSNTLVIGTDQRQYSIEELKYMRNYAAHGQAVSTYYTIDYKIIFELHQLLKVGLSNYWKALQDSEDLCNRLAKANIIPFRGINLIKFVSLMNKNSSAQNVVNRIFEQFDVNFII